MLRTLLFLVISLTNGYMVSLDKEFANNMCHYSDPYQGPCRSDEVNVTLNYPFIKPRICTTQCLVDSDCPKSKCSLIIATPKCILEDEFGFKFCGLPCKVSKSVSIVMHEQSVLSPPPFPCSIDEFLICLPTKVNGTCVYLR